MPVALFSGFLPESCAFLAKGGSGQGFSLDPPSCTLGHPQGSLLPTLLSASALPTEAGRVAQMYLVHLWGWGAVSLRVRRREPTSWKSLYWLGKGCESWNAGWEERPRPPHRKFCGFSASRQGQGGDTPLGEGGVIDAPSRPPGSDQG